MDSRTRFVSLLISTIEATLQVDIHGACQQCDRPITHSGPQKVAGGDFSAKRSQMQLLPLQYPCPADWSSEGHKTTAGPRLHPLCTTPKVLITMTIMQEMATTTSYKNMQSTSLPPRYIPSHKSKVKLEVGPGAPPDFKFTNNISILSNHQDPPERPRRRCAGVLSLQVLWTSPWLDGFQQGEVEEFAA